MKRELNWNMNNIFIFDYSQHLVSQQPLQQLHPSQLQQLQAWLAQHSLVQDLQQLQEQLAFLHWAGILNLGFLYWNRLN